jgi:hypothetical protein
LKREGKIPLLISQVERKKKEQKKVEHKANEWGIEIL